MKKTVIIKFEETDEGSFRLNCAMNAEKAQFAIGDALQRIRNRLKYESDNVSESEEKVLTEIRAILAEVVVEE